MFLLSCLRSPRKSQKGSFQEQALREARIQSLFTASMEYFTPTVHWNELIEKSFNPRDQIGAGNNFIHQADAIGFVRIDDFA